VHGEVIAEIQRLLLEESSSTTAAMIAIALRLNQSGAGQAFESYVRDH
jgi:hypothetical protein